MTEQEKKKNDANNKKRSSSLKPLQSNREGEHRLNVKINQKRTKEDDGKPAMMNIISFIITATKYSSLQLQPSAFIIVLERCFVNPSPENE